MLTHLSLCRDFVEEKLGSRYVIGRSVDFAVSFEESGPATPMFFILSPGVDPLKDVEKHGAGTHTHSYTHHIYTTHTHTHTHSYAHHIYTTHTHKRTPLIYTHPSLTHTPTHPKSPSKG